MSVYGDREREVKDAFKVFMMIKMVGTVDKMVVVC